MPILGAIPVVDEPYHDPSHDETRYLAFRSLTGDTVLPCSGNEFIGMNGMTGLDWPDVEIIEQGVPGMDGTIITDVRTLPRDIFIPMLVRSASSHWDFLSEKRGNLRSLFNHRLYDYRSLDGTFDLVADSLMGQRTLRCIYVDGMQGSLDRKGRAGGPEWQTLGLKLRSVQPYWHGDRWETFVMRKVTGDAFWFPDFPGEFAPSSTLNRYNDVEIPGDAPSWVTVEMGGPCSAASIAADGLSVAIPLGLAANETATIVTDPRGRIAAFNGVRDWTRVAPSDRYQPLAPGIQKIAVYMADATDDTYARVSGPSVYLGPW